MLHPKTLETISWECIHFESKENIAAILDKLSDRLTVRHLAGGTIEDDHQFLRAIAEVLEFPYFGMNWDALDDCLRDLEWLNGEAYVLFVQDARTLWRQAPESAGKFIEAWLFCAEFWAEYETPFHLVFVW